MGRRGPKPGWKGPKTTKSHGITFPDKVWYILSREAARRGCTTAQIVRNAVDYYIDQLWMDAVVEDDPEESRDSENRFHFGSFGLPSRRDSSRDPFEGSEFGLLSRRDST
jgi:hypothetical protein